MNSFKRIFVGGLPRSGTTMVQNILDSHPKIYGGPEFDRLPNIMDLRTKLLATLKAGRIEAYTSKENIDIAIKNLVNQLFNGIETNKSIQYISEKTPWNILFFDELFEVFPEAKFVMVLRNPLHVFNSMKKVAAAAKEKNVVPPDFTTNYLIAVAYMEQVYKIMERLAKTHPNRFYIIKYENLLTDLESESRALCNFIGVDWDSKLLDFNAIEHPGEKTMTKNEVWYTKDKFRANPKLINNTKVKLILSYKEKAFITYMLKNKALINSYFKNESILYKILGKIIYINYKFNYQFKSIPKRVLN